MLVQNVQIRLDHTKKKHDSNELFIWIEFTIVVYGQDWTTNMKSKHKMITNNRRENVSFDRLRRKDMCFISGLRY